MATQYSDRQLTPECLAAIALDAHLFLEFSGQRGVQDGTDVAARAGL